MRYSPATYQLFQRTRDALDAYLREQVAMKFFLESVELDLVGHISPRLSIRVRLKDGRFAKKVISLNPSPVTPRVIAFLKTLLPQKEI